MADKATRVVIVPVVATPVRGIDGKPLFHLDKTPVLDEQPDFGALGFRADHFSVDVRQNYHDVMKVRVRGDADQVHAFAKKSEEYFKALWGKKDDEEN